MSALRRKFRTVGAYLCDLAGGDSLAAKWMTINALEKLDEVTDLAARKNEKLGFIPWHLQSVEISITQPVLFGAPKGILPLRGEDIDMIHTGMARVMNKCRARKLSAQVGFAPSIKPICADILPPRIMITIKKASTVMTDMPGKIQPQTEPAQKLWRHGLRLV